MECPHCANPSKFDSSRFLAPHMDYKATTSDLRTLSQGFFIFSYFHDLWQAKIVHFQLSRSATQGSRCTHLCTTKVQPMCLLLAQVSNFRNSNIVIPSYLDSTWTELFIDTEILEIRWVVVEKNANWWRAPGWGHSALHEPPALNIFIFCKRPLKF